MCMDLVALAGRRPPGALKRERGAVEGSGVGDSALLTRPEPCQLRLSACGFISSEPVS